MRRMMSRQRCGEISWLFMTTCERRAESRVTVCRLSLRERTSFRGAKGDNEAEPRRQRVPRQSLGTRDVVMSKQPAAEIAKLREEIRYHDASITSRLRRRS